MFNKILIANRGEIALRIIRACHELNIQTVVAHSTADADSMPVRLSDESVCIGPATSRDSYLNVTAILSAATVAGVDAIHPGIGFLAENAAFAKMVAEHGFTFIGPDYNHIESMGDKITAKKTMIATGVPVVPGSKGGLDSAEEALMLADDMGYPVLIKAASGGGGRGMQVVRERQGLVKAYDLARKEAEACFGDSTVYMEKYLAKPRHIEVQVIGDKHGNVIHLGERDCSLQRRHQKVLEECPSPIITDQLRQEIGDVVVNACKKIGYHSAGTFEFLFEDGKFYFIEMNTRLQVEHTITEEVTGVDILKEQIKVAAGQKLKYKQDDIKWTGHAIECRVNAEHPRTFIPSPGKIKECHAPGGPGIRVDSAIYSGYTVPSYYDSLVSKLIVHADDRDACIRRTKRALREYAILGIHTNIELHQILCEADAVVKGDYDIHWLEKYIATDDK
jgi:acetyl-CoA carboxylase biotin carboxylase subunit